MARLLRVCMWLGVSCVACCILYAPRLIGRLMIHATLGRIANCACAPATAHMPTQSSKPTCPGSRALDASWMPTQQRTRPAHALLAASRGSLSPPTPPLRPRGSLRGQFILHFARSRSGVCAQSCSEPCRGRRVWGADAMRYAQCKEDGGSLRGGGVARVWEGARVCHSKAGPLANEVVYCNLPRPACTCARFFWLPLLVAHRENKTTNTSGCSSIHRTVLPHTPSFRLCPPPPPILAQAEISPQPPWRPRRLWPRLLRPCLLPPPRWHGSRIRLRGIRTTRTYISNTRRSCSLVVRRPSPSS